MNFSSRPFRCEDGEMVKGFRFHHSRVIEADGSPMLYEVTKIARGTVYYRPVDGGGSECCPVEDFARIVKS